jgi:hypothetical protein
LDISRRTMAAWVRRCVSALRTLRLPELVTPAQAVAGGENIYRQVGDEQDEWIAVLHGQFDNACWVIGTENFG